MTMIFDFSDIPSLIAHTEQNIKRIERVQHAFVYPVLNEWRYAMHHLYDGSENGKSSCICHLQRAYFDSCDILKITLLDRLRSIFVAFDGYADDIVYIIPEYASLRREVREINNAVFPDGDSDISRFEFYSSLSAKLSRLEEILNLLEANTDAISQRIRKTKRKSRLELIGLLLAFLTLIVSIVGLLLR